MQEDNIRFQSGEWQMEGLYHDGLRLPTLSAVMAGSRDEFAPPDLIRPLMGQWNPAARLDIIDGADHFFFGFLDEVTRRLVQCV